MDGVSSHSTLSLRLASSVSCPGSLIKVAQERDLSNVFVVVENRLSQCWSSFPHSPDIQASLTQTHQSTGHCDSARKWAEAGRESDCYAAD